MIDGSQCDPWQKLEELFSTRSLDVFIDNTGNTAVIERGYKLVCSRGRVILVGVSKKGQHVQLYTLPLHFGKILTGSTGGEAVPHEDIPRYMALTAARGMDLNALITDVAGLGSINHLISQMRGGQSAGRCLIDFTL